MYLLLQYPDGREQQMQFQDEAAFFVFRKIASGLRIWNDWTGTTDDGRAFNMRTPPEIPAQNTKRPERP